MKPSGGYSRDSGGVTWNEIKNQVNKFLAEFDFSEMIQAAFKKQCGVVVDEIVQQMIKGGSWSILDALL
jgi:hypothetical protein